MEWLQNVLSGENGSAIQLVLITLVLMIALIFIVWLVRRIAGSPTRKAARNRVPRLSITDSATVDDKRYLVLVRRDNVEHLVLIGGPTDVVVETNIVRVQPAVQPQSTPASALAVVEEEAVSQTTVAETIAEEPAKPAETVPVAAAAATVAAVTLAVEEEEAVEAPSAFEDIEIEVTEESTVEAPAETEPEQTSEPTAPDTIATETPATEAATSEVAALDEDIMSDVLEDLDIEVDIEPAEVDEVEPTSEVNLEEAISEQLDSALSNATFDVEPKAAPDPITKPDSDNEMQRLLDELAGETKETA